MIINIVSTASKSQIENVDLEIIPILVGNSTQVNEQYRRLKIIIVLIFFSTSFLVFSNSIFCSLGGIDFSKTGLIVLDAFSKNSVIIAKRIPTADSKSLIIIQQLS